jgi:hypothetical protein
MLMTSWYCIGIGIGWVVMVVCVYVMVEDSPMRMQFLF